MIRVVVVDDSALARKLISEMLESDPKIKVIGAAANGIFALRRVYRDKPDVVTMDFEMPQMDGLEALKAIMERHPTPVVMISSHTQHGADVTVRALELGAVDFIAKPSGRESAVLRQLRKMLVERVKAAARAHVKALPQAPPDEVAAPPVAAPAKQKRKAPRARKPVVRKKKRPPSAHTSDVRVIAIGASTGGVPRIEGVLRSLPADAPPCLVVQHMPATFTASFAERLDAVCSVTVREAQGGETLEPGLAFVARGGVHLGVKAVGSKLVTQLDDGPEVSGHKPSVDYLFGSCAREVGEACVGVILSGMGKDGAKGLHSIHEAGGRTIAESEESCIVFGMPGAAVQLGAAQAVLHADVIASRLAELASLRPSEREAGP